MVIPDPIRNWLSAHRRTLRVKLHLLRLSTKHVAETQMAAALSPLSIGQHLVKLVSFLLHYTVFSICDPMRPTALSAVPSTEHQTSSGPSLARAQERSSFEKGIHQATNLAVAITSPPPPLRRNQSQQKKSTGTSSPARKTIRGMTSSSKREKTDSRHKSKLVDQVNKMWKLDSAYERQRTGGQVSKTHQHRSSGSQSTSVSESGTPAKQSLRGEMTTNPTAKPRPRMVPPIRPSGHIQGTFRSDGLFLPIESSLNYSSAVPFMGPNHQFMQTPPTPLQMSTTFDNHSYCPPYGTPAGIEPPPSQPWTDGYTAWYQNYHYQSPPYQVPGGWHETTSQYNAPQTVSPPWYMNAPRSLRHDTMGAPATHDSQCGF